MGICEKSQLGGLTHHRTLEEQLRLAVCYKRMGKAQQALQVMDKLLKALTEPPGALKDTEYDLLRFRICSHNPECSTLIFPDSQRNEQTLLSTYQAQLERHGRNHPESIQAHPNLFMFYISKGRYHDAAKIGELIIAAWSVYTSAWGDVDDAVWLKRRYRYLRRHIFVSASSWTLRGL